MRFGVNAHFYVEAKLCCILNPEDAFGEVYLGDDECWRSTVAEISALLNNLPKGDEFGGGIYNGAYLSQWRESRLCADDESDGSRGIGGQSNPCGVCLCGEARFRSSVGTSVLPAIGCAGVNSF